MTTTQVDIQHSIDRLLDERVTHEKVVSDTRNLLARADQRKRENPSERERWVKTIASLEKKLATSKSALNRVEREVASLRERHAEAPPGSPSSTIPSSPSEKLTTQTAKSTAAATMVAAASASQRQSAPVIGSGDAERRRRIVSFRRVLDKCIPDRLSSLSMGEVALVVRTIEQFDSRERRDLLDATALQRLSALRSLLRESAHRLDSLTDDTDTRPS